MTTVPRPGRARRASSVFAAVTLLAMGVSACGGGNSDDATTKPSTAQSSSSEDAGGSLNDMLPADIRETGVLKIGTEAFYPPFESFGPGKEIVGLDPDLAQAIADALGVKYTMTSTAFDGLLPALSSGRYDLVMAAVTDTKVRQEQYDFVDYFTTGQAIVVKKGNPEGITAIEDLCGRNVSVLTASTQEKLLNEFNGEECATNKIKIASLPTDKDALLQIQNGRADAEFTQDAVGRYNAKTAGGGASFEVANDQPIIAIPVGAVFTKDATELRDAFQAALKEIIASGEYEKILADNDLSAGALLTAPINSGTS